jgi:hypothetical protein
MATKKANMEKKDLVHFDDDKTEEERKATSKKWTRKIYFIDIIAAAL